MTTGGSAMIDQRSLLSIPFTYGAIYYHPQLLLISLDNVRVLYRSFDALT
jgi:hypothetical protein